MQIPAFSAQAQNILSGSAQNIDGSRQTPASVGGTSQPDDRSQLSGNLDSSQAVQSPNESLTEVAAPQQTEGAQTQVVTSVDAELGTSLGLIVDTTA